MYKTRVQEASPHLFPTGLDVAVIGVVVVAQLANITAEIAANAKDLNFFIIEIF